MKGATFCRIDHRPFVVEEVSHFQGGATMGSRSVQCFGFIALIACGSGPQISDHTPGASQQNAQLSGRTENDPSDTIYLCDVETHQTNLEGVTIRRDGTVGIYTTSATWGAVDEHIVDARLTREESTLNYETDWGEFWILRNDEIRVGDQVEGEFSTRDKIQIGLTCEYMNQE